VYTVHCRLHTHVRNVDDRGVGWEVEKEGGVIQYHNLMGGREGGRYHKNYDGRRGEGLDSVTIYLIIQAYCTRYQHLLLPSLTHPPIHIRDQRARLITIPW